jgi:putative heme iron utilization protein
MNESIESQDGATSLAFGARELVMSARHGILSTIMSQEGYPYGSLVEIMPLPDGDILLFLSQLAEHRRFIVANPRASVVIAPHIQDLRPLAQPRVTLVGRAEIVEDRDAYAQAYVQLHPGAAGYINFPDFGFYRLRVELIRYIAGFGQLGWVDRDAYSAAFDHPA